MIRQGRGLAQYELAYRCGIGRSQLSKFEADKETMRLDTLGKLLGVLQVEPEQFFRFVRSVESSLRPERQRANAVEDRVLNDAFLGLRSAIDNLQQVLERSLRSERPAAVADPDHAITSQALVQPLDHR
jgi:transcriptional regulator with XRE-family HTH domain